MKKSIDRKSCNLLQEKGHGNTKWRNIFFGFPYDNFSFLHVALFSIFTLFTMNHISSAAVKQKITAGWNHTIALKSNGKVSTWGWNAFGQLGDGTAKDRNTPVEVDGIKSVDAVAGGWLHTAALKSDGTVWTWGGNVNGQLGDGTNSHSNTPVQVTGLSDVISIACGAYFTAALKSDGTVWTWGDNVNGQLGDGTFQGSNFPVQVSELNDVIAIACGYAHVLALRSDGTVWAWGLNSYGQLGDETTVIKNTPVQVNQLRDVIALACGGLYSVALKSDNTVWTWGFNLDGELGDGTFLNRSAPVQVIGLTGINTIAAGKYHTIALKSDGTTWTWGYNNYGQLGDGTLVDKNKPVRVRELTDTLAAAGGLFHTPALKANGRVWTCGYNGFGQLGDGTNTDKKIPEQIESITLDVFETATEITSTLTIDGNLDESDWNVSTDVSNVVLGKPNNDAKFGVLWDNTYLYIGVEVRDGSLHNDSEELGEDDSVEIYIDGDHNAGTTYDDFDFHFIKGWNDSTLFEKKGKTTGVLHGWAPTPGGYSIELAIPWNTIGIRPVEGLTIGFSAGYNDDDDGGEREGQAVWVGTKDNDKDTSALGDVILGDVLPPTPTPTPTPIITSTSTPTPAQTITPIVTPLPRENLKAFYTFDEGSGTVATDTSGNGNDGTIHNATWATGKNGGALSFGGDSYVEISGLLGEPQNITLSAWANLSSADGGGAEVISLGNVVAIRLDDTYGKKGATGFYYNGDKWSSTATGISYAGSGWHHFVYVIDGNTHTQKIYVDGVMLNSTAYTQPIVYGGLGQNTFIGKHGNGVDNYDFNGLIDDVCIYNRALSDQEVHDLHCLVSNWKFDEGSGTVATDASGNGNDGTVHDATWTTGKSGDALSFDGIDDYVDMGNPSNLQPDNVSLSVWFKTGATDGMILRKRLCGYGLQVLSSGEISFWIYNITATKFMATSPKAYNDDKWHHAVGVYDGASVKLYLDGILVSTASAGTIVYKNGAIAAGRDGDFSGSYFNGLIDDIRIYNQALNDQQVQYLYNSVNQ